MTTRQAGFRGLGHAAVAVAVRVALGFAFYAPTPSHGGGDDRFSDHRAYDLPRRRSYTLGSTGKITLV